LLSVTLVPVLMMLFIRGKIMPEAKNPVNRFLIWAYRPIIAGVMQLEERLTIVALARDRAGGLDGTRPASWARVHADTQ
jgi:Cu(I)/Ag(I) efflux system membrane protein CusA/SilA